MPIDPLTHPRTQDPNDFHPLASRDVDLADPKAATVPVPWHPDIAELAPRIARRVVRDVERLSIGQHDIWGEPVLVAMRRHGDAEVFDIADATGRKLAEARYRKPRWRGNGNLGSRAVNVFAGDNVMIFRSNRTGGVWSLKLNRSRRGTATLGVPEDLVGIAYQAVTFADEQGTQLGLRVVVDDEIAIGAARFLSPIVDSVEIDGRAVAVIAQGSTAPVRSPLYRGLDDGAPWRVLARLQPIPRPLAPLLLCDWMSPAHGP